MDKFIVTFARGFGTGGKAIASQLAKDLGIHCYENRILTLASQLSGLPKSKERRKCSRKRICRTPAENKRGVCIPIF